MRARAENYACENFVLIIPLYPMLWGI